MLCESGGEGIAKRVSVFLGVGPSERMSKA